MRILFSADWHIKLGQKNVPTSWARSRYYSFFDKLKELEENVDLHIIGGDIFDRVPTLDELELYFSFVKSAKIETIIYDGNHEIGLCTCVHSYTRYDENIGQLLGDALQQSQVSAARSQVHFALQRRADIASGAQIF
jgi:hypothetical protein